MNILPFMLAWRYLKNTHREKNIATVAKIIFFSIALGTCGLAMIAGIMRGIEIATHRKLQGVHPQIILRSNGNYLDAQALCKMLKKKFPEISAISPISFEQVVINQQSNVPLVVFLKAIDPHLESLVTSLQKTIIKGPSSLQASIYENNVIIGSSLAQILGVSLHDTLDILCLSVQSGSEELSFKKHTVIVRAIIKTGIDDFDASIMICHQQFFKTIFPDAGVSELHLAIAPETNEQNLLSSISHQLGIEAYSWQDLYPSLMAALKLEKYALCFIFAFIVLIACITITSLIFMQILIKQIDIALLYSLGMQPTSVQKIFFSMTFILTSSASLIGLFSAYLIGKLIQLYPWIELPDVYYVTTLPFEHDWRIYLLIFIFSMLLSFLAALIPMRKISALQTSYILRNNG